MNLTPFDEKWWVNAIIESRREHIEYLKYEMLTIVRRFLWLGREHKHLIPIIRSFERTSWQFDPPQDTYEF